MDLDEILKIIRFSESDVTLSARHLDPIAGAYVMPDIAAKPPRTFMGFDVLIDLDLPDNVIEIRSAAGEVVGRIALQAAKPMKTESGFPASSDDD